LCNLQHSVNTDLCWFQTGHPKLFKNLTGSKFRSLSHGSTTQVCPSYTSKHKSQLSLYTGSKDTRGKRLHVSHGTGLHRKQSQWVTGKK